MRRSDELDAAERRNATVLYELFGAIDEFVGSNDWSLPSFRVYSGRHRVVYIHEADLPDRNLYYVAMYDADQNGVPLACEEEHIIYTGTPKEFGYALEEARIVMKCLAVLEKQENN